MRPLTKKRNLLLVGLLLGLLLLSGCSSSGKGKELPDGMDESAVLDAGREIVTLLNEGDYQQVYDRLRDDVQQASTVEDIQSYMEAILKENGLYVYEKGTLVTGQTLDSGEETAIAVFYCQHRKNDVRYRISFDTEMEMTGFEIVKPSLFGT
jgi:hypothetical protein